MPEVIDYPRDVQPVWDRHCVARHSAEEPLGHVVLTGDHPGPSPAAFVGSGIFSQIDEALAQGGRAALYWQVAEALMYISITFPSLHRLLPRKPQSRLPWRAWATCQSTRAAPGR